MASLDGDGELHLNEGTNEYEKYERKNMKKNMDGVVEGGKEISVYLSVSSVDVVRGLFLRDFRKLANDSFCFAVAPDP